MPEDNPDREALMAKIKTQGDVVRKLKEQKAEKDQVNSLTPYDRKSECR